jgi:hypothetical protein
MGAHKTPEILNRYNSTKIFKILVFFKKHLEKITYKVLLSKKLIFEPKSAGNHPFFTKIRTRTAMFSKFTYLNCSGV